MRKILSNGSDIVFASLLGAATIGLQAYSSLIA